MAAPQPFNERFAESNYSGGIPLEPSTIQVTNVVRYPERRTNQSRNIARNSRQAVRTGRRAVGSTMQMGGMALQVTGKATKVAGDTATRTGVTLSRTGVGAIVGAPLAVGGRLARLAGSATDAAGKLTRRTGSRVKGTPGVVSEVGSSAASFKLALSCATWLGWVWVMVQMPFAILTILFFGLTYGFFVISNSYYVYLTSIVGKTAAQVVTEWTAGFFGPASIAFAEALFYIFWMTTMVVGLIQIFAVIMIYGTSLFRPFGGRGAILKHITVLAVTVGYIIPFVNIFPWVFLYLLVLVRYPK